MTHLKSLRKPWNNTVRLITWLFTFPRQPRVSKQRDRHGRLCWKIYYPTTRKTVFLHSNQSILTWVDDSWLCIKR
ncbi:hypothetical protein H6G89_16250 [Oscillatoria sp. FACHB-1407]|uniref:hypothetical protein n=1 Tax=Oscillatoria sp. FACHB-1407 TaxID=2692847 RepID=UPI001689F3EE|nr:hypothetical protein [Oscillatoria sp. FACHB-1407]MBD2462593.1 hypothetical protein [Oscillatoria sp. FACHB-1407]